MSRACRCSTTSLLLTAKLLILMYSLLFLSLKHFFWHICSFLLLFSSLLNDFIPKVVLQFFFFSVFIHCLLIFCSFSSQGRETGKTLGHILKVPVRRTASVFLNTLELMLLIQLLVCCVFLWSVAECLSVKIKFWGFWFYALFQYSQWKFISGQSSSYFSPLLFKY